MIGKLNTTLVERDEWMVLTLHQTDIVKWTPLTIILNHGGYVTSTTKRRMNQCSEDFNLEYRVYSIKGIMWVSFRGQDFPINGHEMWIKR